MNKSKLLVIPKGLRVKLPQTLPYIDSLTQFPFLPKKKKKEKKKAPQARSLLSRSPVQRPTFQHSREVDVPGPKGLSGTRSALPFASRGTDNSTAVLQVPGAGAWETSVGPEASKPGLCGARTWKGGQHYTRTASRPRGPATNRVASKFVTGTKTSTTGGWGPGTSVNPLTRKAWRSLGSA